MKLDCQIILGTGIEFVRAYRNAVEIEDLDLRKQLRDYADNGLANFAKIVINDLEERNKFLAWYNRKKVET